MLNDILNLFACMAGSFGIYVVVLWLMLSIDKQIAGFLLFLFSVAAIVTTAKYMFVMHFVFAT